MKRLRLFVAVVSVVALVGLFVAVPVAQAVFPGDNGKIAFTRQHPDGTTDIFTVNPDGNGLTQLTSAAGHDEHPAFSADGAKIAFASDRTGDWAIYTMNADGSNVTQVSNVTNDFDWEPSWAPGGDRIAWTHEGGGDHGVWIRDLPSGFGYEILDTAWSPDWSPNGTRLAMTSFRSGDTSAELYTIAPNGSGGPQQITDNARAEDDVDWAPDGSKLVFNQFDFDGSMQVNNELWTLNPDGSGLNLLYDQEDAFQPTFSPDGTKVAFQQSFDIVRIPSSGGSPTTIVGGSSIDYDPDWGPTPTEPTAVELIAFTSERDGDAEIMLMATDGSDPTPITSNSVRDDYAAFSPDGTLIAFTSWRDGNAEIYVMDWDGSDQTRITTNPAYDAEPTWSPDGDWLMFVTDRDASATNVGTELQIVKVADPTTTWGGYGEDLASDFSPSWSSDGVDYVSDRDGNNDLYTFIPEGTVTTQLTDNPASDYGPDRSPGGGAIAFARGAPGEGDLLSLDTGTLTVDPLTTSPKWEFSPSWRGDATWLAFSRAAAGDLSAAQIWIMGMQGEQVQLTHATDGANYNPDWGPCTPDAEGFCAPLGPAATVHARTITLELSGSLKVAGRLKCPAASPLCTAQLPVKIQMKVNGVWQTIRSATTDDDGFYEKQLPDVAGKYRAKATKVDFGNDVCAMTTSATLIH